MKSIRFFLFAALMGLFLLLCHPVKKLPGIFLIETCICDMVFLSVQYSIFYGIGV